MRWTAEQFEELKRLKSVGLKHSAIARKMRISLGSVHGKINRAGLTQSGQPSPSNQPGRDRSHRYGIKGESRFVEPYAEFKARKARERQGEGSHADR